MAVEIWVRRGELAVEVLFIGRAVILGRRKISCYYYDVKYAVIFLLLATVYVAYAISTGNPAAKFVALSCALAFGGVGWAYLHNKPAIFLKRQDGTLSVWSYVIFWPYYLLNFLGLKFFRHLGRKPAYNKITDNLYLGCRLSNGDQKALEKIGIRSTLDLTCEFVEMPFLRRMQNYRCVPILDTQTPTVEQLATGASWLELQTAQAPTYVHCAFGHSRSATFVAAYLLQSGQADSIEAALTTITGARPRAHLSTPQFKALQNFYQSLSEQRT